jgi:16S rRNA G1207 methylase RsmC
MKGDMVAKSKSATLLYRLARAHEHLAVDLAHMADIVDAAWEITMFGDHDQTVSMCCKLLVVLSKQSVVMSKFKEKLFTTEPQ